MGRSADEIANEYDLTLAHVYAALAYYYDHQSEIDKAINAPYSLPYRYASLLTP
jgi:uncharacterized protein (DUF433 family)